MLVVPEHKCNCKIFFFLKNPGQYNQDETEDDLRFKFETNSKEGNIVLNSSVYVDIHKFTLQVENDKMIWLSISYNKNNEDRTML